MVFECHDYLPSLKGPPYHYHRRTDTQIDHRRTWAEGAECSRHTMRVVHAIVLSWMGYPSNTAAEAQFYLCDAIIKASQYCSAVFLLEPTWSAFKNIRTFWSGGAQQLGGFVGHDECQRFSEKLAEKSAIFQDISHLSKVAQALAAFRQGASKYYRGPRKRTEATEDDAAPRRDISAFLEQAITGDQLHGMSDSPLSSVPPSLLSSPSSSPLPLPALSLGPVSQGPLSLESMRQFLDYYTSLLPLLNANHKPTAPRQKIVANNMDYMLPFKMHQPALLRAQEPGGPYTYDSIRTRSGIFSLLVFRGCTFGAPAGSTGTLMFRDLDDWNAFRASAHPSTLQNEERFYSNKNAYGTCITQRDSSIVPLLWESSSLLLDKLQTTPSPLPAEIWDYIRSSSQFPGMGNLVAFLIIGDLAHLGVVSMPSAAEVGSMVRKLNKGAFEGLRLLGLDCEAHDFLIDAAFLQLYKYMDEKLSEWEKEASSWSQMVLENGLCKYKRIIAQE